MDSAFSITLTTSSTLLKSDAHFSLLSLVSFNCLACLRATTLFPDCKETNADFLDLYGKKFQGIRQIQLFLRETCSLSKLHMSNKRRTYELKMRPFIQSYIHSICIWPINSPPNTHTQEMKLTEIFQPAGILPEVLSGKSIINSTVKIAKVCSRCRISAE